MIVVTGGAGFIGSNLVQALNDRGISDVIVVDDLTDGTKFRNIADAQIADYLDKSNFLDWLVEFGSDSVKAVFHLGACSATTEWDGRYMLENNFQYSKELFHLCQAFSIPLIYASSAAVYGTGTDFQERIGTERPVNVYGYSKALFDQYLARHLSSLKAQVAGLRYFNVYGPRESHKGAMASVAFHHHAQLKSTGVVKLFKGSGGYADGEQRRDFVYVADVVDVNLWLLDHPEVSGVFNCGTGRAEPFNAIARTVTEYFGTGQIEYIPFPDHLVGSYQSYTCADMSRLRQAGYSGEFRSVAQGVSDYMKWLG